MCPHCGKDIDRMVEKAGEALERGQIAIIAAYLTVGFSQERPVQAPVSDGTWAVGAMREPPEDFLGGCARKINRCTRSAI